MRSALVAGTVGVLGFLSVAQAPTPANAALLSISNALGNCGGFCEGLTYTLEAQATANPLTEQFALVITGVNSGTDTRGGRTGINAIAFNLVDQNPPSPVSGQVLGTILNGNLTLGTNGFTFQQGGLASGGCNGSGNFFCFENGSIPPIPAGLLTSPVVIGFEATLAAGDSWANYAPSLKIDWVGPTINNYSLVSQDIPVNTTCPDCVINPVLVDAPEPLSLAVLGVGLVGLAAAKRRRRV